ncbi:unnamed protein product [Amoebophrya sp. A25]|nr:unnamed protein product [Amoebophrya sp. A25]|eukprot:GSA25T00008803001.1
MNADWQDFVKLRQNTDLKQMEIQNEKVLKILQMKDAKLEELVAEREKETNKARGSEQQLQERLHAAEARQREMLQDLQELETVRGQETKLQQQRVESLQAEAAELREERDRFAALCREVESRSTDELRSVRDALATAERRLCEGDAECERLKDLNAKAAEEIQKLLRECQEKQDELADRGTQRQGAATRRGRSHSPGDHLKEDGRVSSSRAAAAAVRGEIGSTIVSSSSAANNSNLESSSVFCLSQQQEASPQGNAGLVVENSQLAAEVERLQEVLAERDAELEDCERLLHHTRRKDLRTSDMRGGGNKDARICSPDVDASSTNAGAALETVKLMAQLKARLHESETKARKAESDAAELASKLQNTAEAEGEKRVKAEDALKVYTSKTYATGETQTSDAWWNEVQMLSDSAVSAVSAELRSELLKQEQVLHDQRLSAQREERISDDKLRDAQKELEFATKEAADWKKECENGQRTAAADVKEARDRACGLAEKMESLQQEIEVLQEQAGQSRKRHESEKAKLEAEVKTLDSRLNERHAQLVEALGSLEAATKVVNNHSKQGAPAGGPTASGSSSDGGAHAVGVNGQDHDAATSSQVGELLRRVSELTAKNLALTKARAGEQREKRFLEASFELLSREHETVTRRENTLASQLAVARKSLETVEKNCLNKTKAAEDASAALKQSEQERRRLWRDKAHAEEQSEHWRAELARERSEREELCARQVSRLRDERQRLEADVVQASTFGALEALFEQEFDADLHGGSSSSSASSDNKPKDHHHPPASSSSSAAAPGVSTSSNSSGSPRIPSSPVTFSAGLSQTVEDRKRAVKRPPPAPRGPPPSQNAARSRSASRQEQKTTPQVSFLVENETYISSDKHAVTAQSQGAHAHAGQHVQGHSHRGTSSSTQTQTHQHSRNASPSSSSRAPPNKHGNSALFTLLQSTLADLKQVLARRDDSVVDRVGNLYLSLVKKYFISEKQLAFAELRETRSRNQIARYAETAAGGEAKSLKMSGEVKNTSTSSKDSKDSTSSAKSSNQEENSGTTTVEFRTSRPETSSYLAAISELERSLEDTAATTEALRQHSFLLEAQNAELETKLRTQAEVSDRLSTQLALERSGQAANLESARHGMEEEVLAKIGGWKDALLDKVVSLALVGGGGGDSGGNKSASSLLGMNKEKTENLTSTTGKINITGLDSHNDAPLRTAQSTKDTTTGQSATTESSRTSPSDQEQVFEQMEHDLHRPRATARTGFEAAAHAAKVQRHCWSLEIAVQELSEELAKQKLLASSVWQQNTQLKAFIQPSSSGSGPVGGMLGTSGISAATNGGSRSMLDHSGTMLPGVGVAGGVVGSDTVVKNLVGGSAIDPASFDNSALSQVDQLLRSSRKPIYGTTGALQLVPFSYSSTMISAEGSATRLLSQVERRQKEFLATVYQNNEALRVRAQEQLQDKIKHLEQQLQQITLEREKIELERSRLSGAAMESREQTQRQILDLHEEKMREQSAAEAERRRLATTLSQTEIQLEDARRVTREQEDLLSSAMTREKQLREEVLALDGDRAQLQAVLTTERDAAEQGAAELAKVRLELRTATLEAERATNERLQIADAKESTEAELSEQLRAVQARASAAEESLHLRINDLDRLQMQTEKTRLELNSYEQKYTDALEMIDSLQADVGEKHQTDGENEQLRAQVARLELDAGSRELEIQGLVEAFEEVKKQQQPRNSLEGAALGQPSKEELQEETVMRTRVGTADTALAVTISDVVEQQHEIDPFDIGSMLDLQPPQQQPKPTSERLLTARGTDLRSSISLPRFGTNQQDQGCQTLLECPTGLRRAEERCYLVSASDHEALEAKMTKLRDKVASLEKRRALERQRVEEAAAREQQELISRLEALLDAQKHLQEKYITVKTAKKTLEARVMDLEQQNFSLLSQEEAEDRKASTNATRHDQLQHLADSPGDSAIVGVERAKAEMVVAVQGAGSTTLTANESTSGEADSSCSSSSSSPALGEPMSGTSNASAKKVVSSIETQTESGDASRSVDTSTKASQSEARPLSLCLRPAGDLSTVIDVYPDTMFQAKKAALAELLDGTQAI